MREVRSDALDAIGRALGLSGPVRGTVQFTDGILEQVIDVAPLIRRGRTQAATDGIYTAVLQNVHAAANTQTSTVSPYDVAAADAIAPYPAPMPAGFDIWLISAYLEQDSGSGTLSAALIVNFRDQQQGWGRNQAGAAVVATGTQLLAFWDALATQTREFGILNELGIWKKIGLRLPADSATDLVFSSTSSAAATFSLHLLLGVFPIGLGQDVLVGGE